MVQDDPSVFILLSDKGWILENLARQIVRHYPAAECGTAIRGCPDIVYYMTYGARKRPYDGIEIGYFTHIEEGLPAEQNFYDAAAEMDACVCQAELYAGKLRERGVKNVHTIPCGIDHKVYSPCLQVGIVGRTYHTGRKNETMIAELMDMDYVHFRFTGDGWPGRPENIPDGEMADFYRSLDYVLVPSLYEGGPMCVPEALACGTPVIAPEIGWVPDFPHISYEKGNSGSLRAVLNGLVEEKLALARTAAEHTSERWGRMHRQLFREIWARADNRPASMASTGSALDNARVVQVLHGGERYSKGGPSVRVPYTAEQLEVRCARSELSYGAPKGGKFEIAHLYNIWQPDTALRTLESLSPLARKRVFSPILLDLTLRPFWNDELPALMAGTVGGSQAYTETLPQLQNRYLRALDRREEVRRGYQPVPGFAARLRRLVGTADRIVFLSDFERTLAEEYCGMISHATILRNPVDASFFSPHRPAESAMAERLSTEFGVAPGQPFLLAVGRVEVRKNQLHMAALAQQLEMPLVIAGHFGEQNYVDMVTAVGSGHAHFLGRVEPHSEDLLWLYQNCALFMSLSWSEGASLSALEAASTGAPLLLSNTSSEREYFDGYASFVSPLAFDDAIDTARAMMQSPRHDRAAMQHDAIRSSYDWPVHVAALAEIYSSLLET